MWMNRDFGLTNKTLVFLFFIREGSMVCMPPKVSVEKKRKSENADKIAWETIF